MFARRQQTIKTVEVIKNSQSRSALQRALFSSILFCDLASDDSSDVFVFVFALNLLKIDQGDGALMDF